MDSCLVFSAGQAAPMQRNAHYCPHLGLGGLVLLNLSPHVETTVLCVVCVSVPVHMCEHVCTGAMSDNDLDMCRH